MKKKFTKKQIIFFIIILIVFALSLIVATTVKADSGFDSSYDSDSSDSKSGGGGFFSILELLFYLFKLFIILWHVNPFLGLAYLAVLIIGIILVGRYIFSGKKTNNSKNETKNDIIEEDKVKEENENDD